VIEASRYYKKLGERGVRRTAAILDISSLEITPSLAPVFLCCMLPALWQSQRVHSICRPYISHRPYQKAGRSSQLLVVLSSQLIWLDTSICRGSVFSSS